MSKFFYDCEFIEDGKTIDLISIGVVHYETGDTFYAVSNEFDTAKVSEHWWLMENVMNSIDHQPYAIVSAEGFPVKRMFDITDEAARSREEIKRDLSIFLLSYKLPIELWAWYSAYDHVCLAQLFGDMSQLPSYMPMTTFDIKQLHKQAGYCEMPKQPDGKHNALADAQFNVVRYNYLMEVINGSDLRTT